jgi:hypothetical protein
MGTSSAYGGPGGSTPLVPTWLEPNGTPPPSPDGLPGNGDSQNNGEPLTPNAIPPNTLPVQPSPNPRRFVAARNNFSRFAGSGGRDRASLGRAVSQYVSTSSGGARQAARRMGSSRAAGGRLLGFLSDAVARGAREALRTLNLEGLAGRPIEAVFLGLVDYICPDGGNVDEGIARNAFIETIADLAENGIANLDALTTNQMQTVFELYATHTIEERLCNDIGAKVIILPTDAREATQVQTQLRDFIRRGVADALTVAREAMQALTTDNVHRFVDGVYEQAFAILQSLGEREAAV